MGSSVEFAFSNGVLNDYFQLMICGLCRKVLTFLLVGIAQALDVHVLNQPGVLRTAVIFWAIANNGLSILENAAHLGLPVPE